MAVEEHKHQCDVHQYHLESHAARLDKLDEILDKVRNRLPVWATVAIGLLLAAIGWLAANGGVK
jgi:hypothetical protein